MVKFSRDDTGASAIEFAFVFPIMLIVLAGTVDLSQALVVSRKMNQLTATVGDMISQKSNWTSSDVGAIMAGAATIIQPFDGSQLAIQLAVVDTAPDLSSKVSWAQGYKVTALQKGEPSPVPVPQSISETGVQLIAVSSTFS